MIPVVVEDGQLVGGPEVVGVGQLVGLDVGLNLQDFKPPAGGHPALNSHPPGHARFAHLPWIFK